MTNGEEPPAPAPMRRIFHFHIFKNAGTTVNAVLEQNFGGLFSSFDGADPAGCLGGDEIAAHVASRPDAVAFTSHQAKPPLPFIEGSDFFSMIFIRHPVDRIGSIYHFEQRRSLDDPTSAKARELSLAEYVEWVLAEQPTRNFFNFQCLYCSSKRDYLRGEVNEEDFREAAARVVEMSVAGVVDRFDESMELCATTLRPYFPRMRFDAGSRNVSAGRQPSLAERLRAMAGEIGPVLFRRLSENNEFDLRLYEFTKNLLASRRASGSRAW